MKVHARTLKHVFETLLDQLMRSAYKVKAVDAVELGRDFATEQPASASRAHSPSLYVFGIAPHQITERTLMRYLADSLNGADLHMQTPANRAAIRPHSPSANQPPIPSFLTHRLPAFSRTQ